MKPTIKLAETTAPDGANFKLFEHDTDFYLYMDDREVMSTRKTHSELMLAEVGCTFRDGRKNLKVLIGGLGLGFSLRRALELAGGKSVCEVAELLPVIVAWNREKLGGLNDDIMEDPRTKVYEGDVYDRILAAALPANPKYDSILLDVDDGPSSLIQPQNSQLYSDEGLELLRSALSPGGRIAFWAAQAEPRLLKSIRRMGFRYDELEVGKHAKAKRRHHRIYLAERKD